MRLHIHESQPSLRIDWRGFPEAPPLSTTSPLGEW
jgi:hypothetical protein